ncbi:MAG: hypothetical protein IMX06_05035 [Kyrpidia tusciae]|nr:hypothetical protein [Kyrpidia tusciae]MBE3552216.1 hypothetical protein [Kyrpidia tusciae]
MTMSIFMVAGLAVTLGFRHGVDWDHIAAITDLVAGERRWRRGLLLAMLYAVGHGAVVCALGIPLMVIGFHVPDGVGRLMEPLVGLTLIVLGLWVLAVLLMGKYDLGTRSRWVLVYRALRRAWHWLRRHPHDQHAQVELGAKGAFLVGIVHGLGAETPTQLLVFAAALQAGGRGIAVGILLLFVTGLLMSNLLISVATLAGYVWAQDRRWWRVALAGATSVYSVAVGMFFVSGHAEWLPPLTGS